MKKSKIITLCLTVIFFTNLLLSIPAVNAKTLPPYDYSSFVGDWYCPILGHTEGTSGSYRLSISAADEDMICLEQMNNTWYQIIDNRVFFDVAPSDGLNFSIRHNTDIYAIELIFCDDSICMTAYSRERYLSDDIAQNTYVDTYWFTSDTIKPRKIVSENYSVVLNGQKLEFDQPPIMVNDRILVPLRKICEELNADVYYDDDGADYDYEWCVISVVKNDTILQIENMNSYTNNNWYFKKGTIQDHTSDNESYEYITMDINPIIINGRTLVPVRTLTESFGAEVSWDETSNTVSIHADTTGERKSSEEMQLSNALTCAQAYKMADNTVGGVGGDPHAPWFDSIGKYFTFPVFFAEYPFDDGIVKVYYNGRIEHWHKDGQLSLYQYDVKAE